MIKLQKYVTELKEVFERVFIKSFGATSIKKLV